MGTSVADLKGPEGQPQRHFTLTAEEADVKLPSGRVVHALTFNGSVPGPELRVDEGDLVEVTLENRDVQSGVTIHWHGVDVPNAEDGVAGVTQNAVPPGGSYTYRFRADQVGTFWYHTHQSSSAEVRRGLYGALVIEPLSRPANAGARSSRRHPHARRHPARQQDGRRRALAGPARDPGTPPPRQHRQRSAQLRHRRHPVPRARDRRNRPPRSHTTVGPYARACGRRQVRRRLPDAGSARRAVSRGDLRRTRAQPRRGRQTHRSPPPAPRSTPPPTARRRRRRSAPRAISTASSRSR